MRAAWAWQDREELREAIWMWLTRPAQQAGSRRAQGGGKGQLIAHAFELWIKHLTLVEQVIRFAPVRWHELHDSEFAGLEMLQAARQRFAAEYRQCGDCGAAVRGKICPRCGALESRRAEGL